MRQIKGILDITLFNSWLWIIVGAMMAIVIGPFAIMFVLLQSPPWLAAAIIILVIIGWGIAGGYKEWLLHKREQENPKPTGRDVDPFDYERLREKDKGYKD
jgi:hypothetical protein